jgi:hypothetical protein
VSFASGIYDDFFAQGTSGHAESAQATNISPDIANGGAQSPKGAWFVSKLYF